MLGHWCSVYSPGLALSSIYPILSSIPHNHHTNALSSPYLIQQLLFFAIFGLQGDYSDNRKSLLLYTSLAGSFSCICFAFFPIGEADTKYV